MTEVFVLQQDWDWEGQEVIGVFSTKELADKAKEKSEAEPHGGSFEIKKFELDLLQ